MPKISVVSLAWNKLSLTKEFLERLKRYTDIPFQLVFTDNGSEEPIPALVKDIFPKADLIVKKKNVGCPATRNEAMKKTTGEIIFWLDNDTYVGSGWYQPFLDKLDRSPKVGLVGVDGRRVNNPFTPENPWQFPENFIPDYNVDWFVGYAVAFRRIAYKPIPDWKLMVNLDDTDLGMGIKANGWKAKMIDIPVNLKHLVSQTGAPIVPDREQELDIFRRWWQYWRLYQKHFCNYE
jgi:GT2 family glycosyltransferase